MGESLSWLVASLTHFLPIHIFAHSFPLGRLPPLSLSLSLLPSNMRIDGICPGIFPINGAQEPDRSLDGSGPFRSFLFVLLF
ncbi:hypothetical protein BJ741DRAFT_585483, partial [Chytriomyces cf. hyalinus JEL632]